MQHDPASPEAAYEEFEALDVYPWPDASRSQRLAACILDVLFVGLIQALGQAFFKGLGPGLLLNSVGLLYYLFSHTYGGQSLGKKIVGLKVVPLDATLENEAVTFRQILARETVGRFVATIVFLIGYLRIFYSSDRRGWHDLIGKTRVVSIAPETSRSVGLGHVFGVLFILITVSLGTVHYMATRTAWPLREVAKQLELQGYEVEGVGGSSREGFTISRLGKKTAEGDFEIKGIQVKRSQKSNGKINIFDALTVESVEVRIKKWPESLEQSSRKAILDQFSGQSSDRGSGLSDETDVASKSETLPKEQEDLESQSWAKEVLAPVVALIGRDLFIKTFDIGQASLILPDDRTYTLDRFFVSNFETKLEEKKLSLGRLWVESKAFHFDLQELLIADGVVSTGKEMRFVVQPGASPELIKVPLDFRGEFVAQGSSLKLLRLKAFKGRVNLSMKEGKTDFSISSFTPSHYFKTKMPIWNVEMKLSGDIREKRFDSPVGSVGLRNTRFDFAANRLVHERAGTKFVMVPRPIDAKQFLSGEEPGWLLGSSHRKGIAEILSELYFGLPLERLDGRQKSMIEKDQAYFMQIPQTMPDLLPASPPVAVPVAEEKPVDPAPKRQPGSDGPKPGFDAKGRPLKLPPYRGVRR